MVGTLWFTENRDDRRPARSTLSEAQLNTIGYVLSRYGGLTGTDLEHLAHSEDPWRRANAVRRPHESARIEQSWLEEYFRGEAEDDGLVLDSADVSAALADADARRQEPGVEDRVEDVIARLSRAHGGSGD